MKNIFYCSLVYLLLVSPPNANADIYKCEIDGKHTYSQFPCGDSAEKINVKTVKSSSKVSYSNKNLSRSAKIEDTNLYVKISKIDRQLRDSNNNIKKYQRKMKSEIKVLKQRANYASSNLAGATYEGALSTQMNAVATKYDSLIDIEQKTIDRLHQQKNLLDEQRKALNYTSHNMQTTSKKTPSIDEYVKNKKIDRSILTHQNKISKYKKKMNREIEQLKVEASWANSNLAGARYESAKSNKMNAVANKYNSLIDTEQRKLDLLYKEKLKK